MTENLIEIQWTSDTLDQARRICRFLVQERYVACAQITPWVESIFLWDNKMDTVQESKVVLKTRMENYDAIRKVIEENSQYEVPQIIWMKIDGGNKDYMDWVEKSTLDQVESNSR